MALLFTATLFVSIIGLVSLVVLKRWEIATGRMLMSAARPALAEAARGFWVWTLERAPERASELLQTAARRSRRETHRLAALTLLKLEQSLERTLRTVRRNTEAPRDGGAASGFLREVAEHKKRLQKRSLKNRSIFEE